MSASAFDFCDTPLPFPAGTSPFRIKGQLYVHLSETLERIDKKSGGKLRACFENEGISDFAMQRFLSSESYDVLPYPRIMMCSAKTSGKDVRVLARKIATSAIQRQMKGTYQSLFRALAPSNVAKRFTGILQYIYDFGSISGEDTPFGAHFQFANVPACFSEWWCEVSAPFVLVPLTANGAKNPRVDWTITPSAASGRVRMAAIDFNVRWDA